MTPTAVTTGSAERWGPLWGTRERVLPVVGDLLVLAQRPVRGLARPTAAPSALHFRSRRSVSSALPRRL